MTHSSGLSVACSLIVGKLPQDFVHSTRAHDGAPGQKVTPGSLARLSQDSTQAMGAQGLTQRFFERQCLPSARSETSAVCRHALDVAPSQVAFFPLYMVDCALALWAARWYHSFKERRTTATFAAQTFLIYERVATLCVGPHPAILDTAANRHAAASFSRSINLRQEFAVSGTFDLRATSGALSSILGRYTTQTTPPEPPVPVHVGPAELPRVVPTYTPTNVSLATRHTPTNAAQLQTLLAGGDIGTGALAAGHVIELARGTVYNSPAIPVHVFPDIPGAATNPITVVTSDLAAIPLPGVRITPANRAIAPHFRCQQNNTPALRVLGSGWHFVGIEADAGSTTSQFGIVNLGFVWESSYDPGTPYTKDQYINHWRSLQNGNLGNPQVEGPWWTRLSPSTVPTNIVLDRCDIAARTYANQCAVVLWCHTASVVIRDSWLWGEGRVASEDKSFATTEMVGPMLFENNTCCSSSIPFLTGGGTRPGWDAIPQDLTIRRNHFFKPTRFIPRSVDWDGNNRQHKNSFELKQGVRVLIENNVFENHYDGFQSQFFAIVFKVANQDGSFNTVQTTDVTFRHNRLVNIGGGFAIGAADRISGGTVGGIGRFSIYENYTQAPLGFWATTPDAFERTWAFQVSQNEFIQAIHIERNTMVSRHPTSAASNTALVVTTETLVPGLVLRSNLLDYGFFGIQGNNSSNRGIATFSGAGSSAGGNFLYVESPGTAPTAGAFPTGQLTTITDAAAMFVNRAAGDYRRAAALAGQGYDGADPGADIDAINARTAGCETGVWT